MKITMKMKQNRTVFLLHDLYGFVQDCSNSIANAQELLKFCTEPSICTAVALFTNMV